MKVWIGVDPGSSGALCALSEDNTTVFKDYEAIPYNLALWLHDISQSHEIQMIMIEDVHAIFGSSAKSTFNFGFNVGILHGIIRTLNLPLDLVQPKAWQKHAGVTAKGKLIKNEVKDIGQRIYPGAQVFGPKGGLLDGRSDALLIASYCKFKHK
jgi:hypothetical protein